MCSRNFNGVWVSFFCERCELTVNPYNIAGFRMVPPTNMAWGVPTAVHGGVVNGNAAQPPTMMYANTMPQYQTQ